MPAAALEAEQAPGVVDLGFHPAQIEFFDSKAPVRAFVGGRGAGKSYVLSFDLISRAEPNCFYLFGAPTYKHLEDGPLRAFTSMARTLRILARPFNWSRLKATLWNGAEVIFRSADNPDGFRGPNLSGVALDEASLMHRDAYKQVRMCLREGGKLGWLTAAFTPKGKHNWTYEIFGPCPDCRVNPGEAHGDGCPGATTPVWRKNRFLVRSRMSDNPFLSREFVEEMAGEYSGLMAAQELEGQWVDAAGGMFKPEWFGVPLEDDQIPGDLRLVRAWDLAATDPNPENPDPDWTAGVLMGKHQETGVYYILDVQRLRGTPLEVEKRVEQTAAVDGKKVKIFMEQEGGSGGKFVIAHFLRVLDGYSFCGDHPVKDKETRASPLASQAQGGRVKLKRGAWNREFLEEAGQFPSGKKDQIDAAALAHSHLAAKPKKVQVYGIGVSRQRVAEMQEAERQKKIEEAKAARANGHVSGAASAAGPRP